MTRHKIPHGAKKFIRAINNNDTDRFYELLDRYEKRNLPISYVVLLKILDLYADKHLNMLLAFIKSRIKQRYSVSLYDIFTPHRENHYLAGHSILRDFRKNIPKNIVEKVYPPYLFNCYITYEKLTKIVIACAGAEIIDFPNIHYPLATLANDIKTVLDHNTSASELSATPQLTHIIYTFLQIK